jgi:hypothetical protein
VKFFIALIFSFLSVASYSQCDTVHNLTISSIGTQSAVISATPSSGSTSFIVYYYPQNDTSKAKYIIGNSPNFTITGLTPNTAYITFMGNWCGPTTIKSQKGKYLFTTAGITQSTNKFLIHNGFGDEYGVLKARKGFILPKADTLAAPLETGEIRYDTASQVNYQWTGEMWQPLAAGGDFQLGYDTNFIKAPLNVLSINTKGLNGYNGVVNVKDYGAIGNGTTDDRAAIQAAFNKAYSLGLDVDLGYGTFYISGPVTLTEFTNTTRKRWPKIYGHGKGIDNGGTRIVAKNIPALHGALEFLGDSNGWVTSAEVSNLEINTEDASNSDSSFCLFVGDARNFEASRLILRGKNNLLLRCGSYAGGQSTYSMINTVFSQVDFFATSSKGWAVAHEGFFNGTIAPAGYDNIQFKNCLFSGLVNLNAHTGSIDACLFAVSPFKDSTTYTTGVLHGLTVNFSTALWISSGQHVSVTNCYFEDYKTAILVQPIDGAVVAATIDRNYFNGITNYPNPDSVNASYPNNYFFADYGVRVKAHPTGGGEVTKVTVSNSTFRDGAGINNHTFNRYPISNEGATKMYVSRSGVYYPNIPLRINGTYIGDPEAAVPPTLQTVLDNGNTSTNDIKIKDGGALKFYQDTTFRGMLSYPVGNTTGSRYIGIYNKSADYLGLISENKTSMQIGTVAHIVLDTAGVHLDNLNTTTTATEEVVLQGGILKRQLINNNPLGNIKVIPDANYTITSTDRILVLNEPTSARTITLPAASTLPNKEITLIVKTTTSGRWILSGSFIQQPGASITEDFINSGLNAITYRLANDGNKWYQE